jgi:transposase
MNLIKIFKDFSHLCKELGLYGEELVAIDGTKIKANNSKRNNYNQKKIDRQIKYIDEKTNEYLKALEENDSQEEKSTKYNTKELKEKIELLRQRKETYEELGKQLNESGDKEISTVDPDSRLMENKKNGLEMAYNLQTAVDSKHNLIVDFDVTQNAADQGNLNSMSQKSKEVFGKDEKDELDVLGDKGYYQAEDLKECEKNNTITYVSKQTYSNSTNDRDFYTDKFRYDKERDIYLCPANEELKRVKHRKEEVQQIRYKNFEACEKCGYKDRCTTAKRGRTISRSKDQDFLDTVDARTQENMDKYLLRQMIVEHPYGTIKRTMNAGYYLCRGMESVVGETSLILFAYNFKRVINILGIEELRRKIAELRPSFSLIFIKNLQIA